MYDGNMRKLAPAMTERSHAAASLAEECEALRKRVEELETSSSSLIRDVFDSSDIGLLILDSNFRVVWVSRALERFFGTARNELLGRDKRELIHERIQFLFEDSATFAKRVLATYDDNTSVETFECHVLPDGNRQERWLEHHSQPILSGAYAGGRIEHYSDVTSRRGAEQALKSSEAKYRSLIEQVPAITYTAAVDEDGSPTFVSPQLKGILGFTPEEWIADPTLWKKQLHPEDADRVLAEVANTRFGEKSILREYRLLTREGHPRWFRDAANLVRDESGHRLFYHGVLLDITEHKAAEAALRESEARFRRLVDANIIGIMIADVYGSIVDANDAFLEMVGYTREDLPFRWDEMTPPEWRSLDEFAIEQLRWTGAATPWEKEYLHNDGRRVPVLIGVSLLDEPSGSCICFVIDLTDSKRTELALRRSERLASVGTLAAGIAHEINNPIGGILMAAQFALKYQADPGSVKTALDDIVRDGARCGRIVKNVLRFAQEAPSERSPADLNPVVQQAADLVQKYGEKKGSVIELVLAEKLPDVMLNPAEIEQVIVNLVGNAAQAGATRVVIRTESAPDAVRLVVEDNGSGISKEDAEHLFDPFYTTRHDRGGMGLGLSIVHGIVKDHEGEIDLDSQPGRGTRLTIRLPRALNDDS